MDFNKLLYAISMPAESVIFLALSVLSNQSLQFQAAAAVKYPTKITLVGSAPTKFGIRLRIRKWN